METASPILNSIELFGISGVAITFSKFTVKKLTILTKNKIVNEIKIIDETTKKTS